MLFKRKARRVSKVCPVLPQSEKISQCGFGTEMPPQKILVEIYFDQKNCYAQAELFYSFYEKSNWSSPKGTAYRNWKLLAAEWIYSFEQQQKLRRRLQENMLFAET